ncbi:hypothetical protein Tco_0515477 [Tanacetum coccineum]
MVNTLPMQGTPPPHSCRSAVRELPCSHRFASKRFAKRYLHWCFLALWIVSPPPVTINTMAFERIINNHKPHSFEKGKEQAKDFLFGLHRVNARSWSCVYILPYVAQFMSLPIYRWNQVTQQSGYPPRVKLTLLCPIFPRDSRRNTGASSSGPSTRSLDASGPVFLLTQLSKLQKMTSKIGQFNSNIDQATEFRALMTMAFEMAGPSGQESRGNKNDPLMSNSLKESSLIGKPLGRPEESL